MHGRVCGVRAGVRDGDVPSPFVEVRQEPEPGRQRTLCAALSFALFDPFEWAFEGLESIFFPKMGKGTLSPEMASTSSDVIFCFILLYIYNFLF
jgi:hypothetical protein